VIDLWNCSLLAVTPDEIPGTFISGSLVTHDWTPGRNGTVVIIIEETGKKKFKGTEKNNLRILGKGTGLTGLSEAKSWHTKISWRILSIIFHTHSGQPKYLLKLTVCNEFLVWFSALAVHKSLAADLFPQSQHELSGLNRNTKPQVPMITQKYPKVVGVSLRRVFVCLRSAQPITGYELMQQIGGGGFSTCLNKFIDECYNM
jgi:hypothetical protein